MPSYRDALIRSLKSSGEFVWEVIKVVVVSLAIIIPVRYFLIQPFYVKGASMEPNFYDYEYLVIDEISYRFRDPARGEVVVLRNPTNPSEYFIKRVIGLPGERVVVRDGKVRINSQPLDESTYLEPDVRTTGSDEVDLGEGEFYVMGDNRPYSLDSRVFGPVTKEAIVGRTWIRAWPPSRLDWFSPFSYPEQHGQTD